MSRRTRALIVLAGSFELIVLTIFQLLGHYDFKGVSIALIGIVIGVILVMVVEKPE